MMAYPLSCGHSNPFIAKENLEQPTAIWNGKNRIWTPEMVFLEEIYKFGRNY